MNERIKKLAEQSGFYLYDMHDVDGQDLGETIEADNWTAAEKFAELIVRECADLCDRFQVRGVGMQPAECAGAIRKMFGIAE